MAIFPPVVNLWIVLGGALFVYGIANLVRRRRFYKDLPKPPHSFLFGHIPLFAEIVKGIPPNCHPQYIYTTLARKYNLPGVFYVDLWPVGPAQIIVTDPAAAHDITTIRPLPKHGEVERFLRPIAGGENIAAVNGAKWKYIHGLVSPGFASSHVKGMVGVMANETLTFRKTLSRLAETGETFSMEETAAKLIFDVIGQIVFHYSLQAQTSGSACLTDIRDMLKYFALERTWNPIDRVKYFFRRRNAVQRVDRFVENQIIERYNTLRQERILPTKRNFLSLLDLMLRQKLEEETEKGAAKSSGLDRDFMAITVTNIKALLIGGHGTTTDTLSFIYMLLSNHPEAADKLREEHYRIFSKDVNETVQMLKESPNKVNDLVYTTSVIKETLRLFPVGFGIRAGQKGRYLNYNGQSLPTENFMIVPLQQAMHFNPDYFPSPNSFDPSRFVDPDPITTKAWRPFERGPRACLGQELAMDELRVVLLLTVRDFDFSMPVLKPYKNTTATWTELDTVYGDLAFQELGLEATPRDGMPMVVSKR